jgi:hypothetical protein
VKRVGAKPESLYKKTPHGETSHLDRYERVQQRSKRRRLELEQVGVVEDIESVQSLNDQGCDGVSSQTDIDGIYIKSNESEIQRLRDENTSLKKAGIIRFSKEDLNGNDEKVKHFTGLQTFVLLMKLFQYLELYLPTSGVLHSFRMMMMTLMRLRLYINISL